MSGFAALVSYSQFEGGEDLIVAHSLDRSSFFSSARLVSVSTTEHTNENSDETNKSKNLF